jgi:hypothetical protein
VFRWYAELRDIEQRHETADNDGATLQELLDELDTMESKVEKVVMPLAFTDELYALRSNIGLVRQKLLQRT